MTINALQSGLRSEVGIVAIVWMITVSTTLLSAWVRDPGEVASLQRQADDVSLKNQMRLLRLQLQPALVIRATYPISNEFAANASLTGRSFPVEIFWNLSETPEKIIVKIGGLGELALGWLHRSISIMMNGKTINVVTVLDGYNVTWAGTQRVEAIVEYPRSSFIGNPTI